MWKGENIILDENVINQIIDNVKRKLPEESCGLIGGIGNQSIITIPIENIMHSEKAFKMNAIEQLNAFMLFENENLDLLAIYHSHPEGPIYPSKKDIDEHHYPGVLSIIVVPGKEIEMKAFLIENTNTFEVNLIRN